MSAADGRDGFEILEALRAPADGCVLCRLEERWLRDWLDGLLYEKVTDRSLRARLREAGGFCPRHARRLTAFRDGLGVAILYGDQLQEAGRLLERAGAARKAGPAPGWERCPACLAQVRKRTHLSQAVAAVLETLPALGGAGLAAAFTPYPRFCLPHLLATLPRIGPAALRRETARLAAAAVIRLEAELDEYRRKADHRSAGEPMGPERDAWLRAVRLMAGGEGIFG